VSRPAKKAKPHLRGFRRRAAFLCLIATFFFQLPVIAGMVIATGVCCTGDRCPIAAHQHTHAAAKTEEAPMDCDHSMNHNGSKLQACSMSCCNTSEQSAVHANVFVLSPVVTLAAIYPLSETLSNRDARESVSSFAPLSPPPEFLPSLI
jgi:hypothetical protein